MDKTNRANHKEAKRRRIDSAVENGDENSPVFNNEIAINNQNPDYEGIEAVTSSVASDRNVEELPSTLWNHNENINSNNNAYGTATEHVDTEYENAPNVMRLEPDNNNTHSLSPSNALVTHEFAPNCSLSPSIASTTHQFKSNCSTSSSTDSSTTHEFEPNWMGLELNSSSESPTNTVPLTTSSNPTFPQYNPLITFENEAILYLILNMDVHPLCIIREAQELDPETNQIETDFSAAGDFDYYETEENNDDDNMNNADTMNEDENIPDDDVINDDENMSYDGESAGEGYEQGDVNRVHDDQGDVNREDDGDDQVNGLREHDDDDEVDGSIERDNRGL